MRVLSLLESMNDVVYVFDKFFRLIKEKGRGDDFIGWYFDIYFLYVVCMELNCVCRMCEWI